MPMIWRTIVGTLLACSTLFSQPEHGKEPLQKRSTLPLAYVETRVDGIAYLPLEDFLSLVPELRGLSSDGLHLRRRGRDIPIALIDNDGYLDDRDTLVFVGTHPTGDTTFWNAYSSVAAFEVWYDMSIPPRRMHRDTSNGQFYLPRQHLWVERHLEEEHQYIQGWLDNNRYTQINSTFVTETVPGERWAWAIVYSNKPFRAILHTAPDPDRGDSVVIKLFYSSIDNDIYTNPDNRLHLWYGGVLRDSAIYDGPRDSALAVVLNPLRDGCIVDTIVLANQAITTASQAVDFITTAGYERAVAFGDRLAGSCESSQSEQLILVNFSSPRVVVVDTNAMRWSIQSGEPGVLFRVAARTSPQRLSIGIGDTAVVATRHPLAIAWMDKSHTVQLYTDNDPSTFAGFLNALEIGTPFAIVISNGGVLNNQLKARLEAEGSMLISTISAQQPYVAVGILGDRHLFQERTGNNGAAALLTWLPTERGNAYRISVPLEPGKHSLVATGTMRWERAHIRLCGGTDLLADTNRADYLIITHRDFRSAAERLAQFRSVRNRVLTRVVDVTDIFDAFGYGEKSPHAIKAFLHHAYHEWQKPAPRAVVLVGDASWDPRKVSTGAIYDDYIPSYGKPVSDFWYTLLEGNDYVPELSIGRLPVRTLQQAHVAIDKIIEHDTMSWQQWQKHFLFISGGADQNEQYDFYQSILYSFAPLLVEPTQRALCADTTTVSFYAGTSSGLPLPTAIVSSINQGVVWINYIGHGAPRSMEVAGWEPERLNNRNRYPILASFSCQIGAFAEPTVSALGEDFLLQPHAGCIAVIATTGFGIRSYDDILNSALFAVLARTRIRTLGELLDRAKSYLNDGTQIAINTIMQTTLLGDPLSRVPIDSLPRPVVDPASVRITTIPPAPFPTADADSIVVEATVFNAGIHVDSTFAIHLIRRYSDASDTTSILMANLCFPERVRFALPIRGMPGEHRLRFEIDPERKLGQQFPPTEVSAYVFAEQLYAVEPQTGWNLSPRDTIVRFLNPFAPSGSFSYRAYIVSATGDTLATSDASPVIELPTHCEWHLPLRLQPGNEYRLLISGHNTVNQTWTPWLVIPVVVTDSTVLNEVSHIQGMGGNWSRSVISGMQSDSSARLVFSTQVDVDLMSAGGYQYREGDTVRVPVLPGYRLRIGGTNIASERSDETGVHVAVISSDQATLKTVRWYSTWTTSPINRSWGDAAALIRFLRDSVSSQDYVLLVSCGPAWSLEFARYAEEFRRVLTEFGARQVAMLDGSRSYIFVGMRNSERPFVFERANTDTLWGGGDTVAAVVSLPLFPRIAQIELPVAGPAAQWKDVRFSHHCNVPMQVEIYGGDVPERTTSFLAGSTSAELSLAGIPAERYPYLRILCKLSRDSNSFQSCTIDHAVVRYVPMPEFVCTVTMDNTNPLRGDTLTVTATIVNLVTRSATNDGIGLWQIRRSDGFPVHVGTIVDTAHPIPFGMGIAGVIPTLLLPQHCFVQFEVTAPRDLYDFNNLATATLTVRDDNDPPTILLFAGNERVHDTAVVAAVTTLSCGLLDSARVPITDSNALILRLNGVRLPVDGMRYAFYPSDQVFSRAHWRNLPLARAAVEADVSLERGVNILHVTARDAFGNITTARYTLVVPNTLTLDSSNVMPNPALSGETVRLKVIYRGFEQTTLGQFELYDVLGRRARSEVLPLTVGPNEFIVPLADQQSNEPLQSGVYYWRLWLNMVGSNDAIDGMIVVVR